MTGRIKGQSEKDQGYGNPNDGNPGWWNNITEDVIWVEGDTGNYRVKMQDFREEKTIDSGIDTKKKAAEIAKDTAREESIDLDREPDTTEKDEIWEYFRDRIIDDIDSQAVHRMIAWYINQNYDVAVEYEDFESGDIESREATIATSQHDHKVYADVEMERGMIAEKNYELTDWGVDDIVDEELQERGLYTMRVWADIQRDKIGGYDAQDKLDDRANFSEMHEKVMNRVGEYMRENYKSQTEDSIMYRPKAQ